MSDRNEVTTKRSEAHVAIASKARGGRGFFPLAGVVVAGAAIGVVIEAARFMATEALPMGGPETEDPNRLVSILAAVLESWVVTGAVCAWVVFVAYRLGRKAARKAAEVALEQGVAGVAPGRVFAAALIGALLGATYKAAVHAPRIWLDIRKFGDLAAEDSVGFILRSAISWTLPPFVAIGAVLGLAAFGFYRLGKLAARPETADRSSPSA